MLKGDVTYLIFTRKVTELLPTTVRFRDSDLAAAPALRADTVLAFALA
jgi:hypothetical protein